MSLLDWFKGKPKPTPIANTETPKVKVPKKSPKDIATENNEPWVEVIGMEIDADNISEGNFELDWNPIFVARLIKAGYSGKTDIEIVDMWFQTVCRNIALESFEQEMADPDKRANWNARVNNISHL